PLVPYLFLYTRPPPPPLFTLSLHDALPIYPPCLPPVPAEGCYMVGSPGEAVAFIRDNEQANQRPVVTIFTKDPFAAEPGNIPEITPDTATFVVHRSGGDFNNPLAISYRISGTASNGVDYSKLSG